MNIVFDASSLISISQTCLIKCLADLRKKLGLDFFVSPTVFREVVSKPIKIKRFALNAVRVNELVEQQEIVVEALNPESEDLRHELDKICNNMFFAKNKPIRIMQTGELEALALLRQLNSKVLVVDERTARMLIENPFSIRSLMERRHHKKIREDTQKLKEAREMFSETIVLRSVELIALAFETNALAGQIENTRDALEAALYAAKFSGCSVSFEEIQEFVGKK
ncbi:MAG: hypothetical protein JW772_01330 [Candidatus Diapherotrites archaeon]|nr:hypothetical protein [Candidatus Diapherotrites archaeon]